MWECTPQLLHGGRVRRYSLLCSGTAVRYRDILRYWREDKVFRDFFISLLSTAPYSSYRWETPPVSTSTADRAFEFVLLDAPELDRPADAEAFADRFRSATGEQSVVAFANLGNDAMLVVPCPNGPEGAYVHLATFVREAPEAQVHRLWQLVGKMMEARLGAQPIWLSTAGMGVAWLHIRIDDRPKYYGHGPYRDER